jgi:hypothetical protein
LDCKPERLTSRRRYLRIDGSSSTIYTTDDSSVTVSPPYALQNSARSLPLAQRHSPA